MSSELDKVHMLLASFPRKFMGRLKQNECKPVIQPVIEPARGCGAGARGSLQCPALALSAPQETGCH